MATTRWKLVFAFDFAAIAREHTAIDGEINRVQLKPHRRVAHHHANSVGVGTTRRRPYLTGRAIFGAVHLVRGWNVFIACWDHVLAMVGGRRGSAIGSETSCKERPTNGSRPIDATDVGRAIPPRHFAGQDRARATVNDGA